jgi:cyclophilin family peptidyl-prolyl cis-trans isomerase
MTTPAVATTPPSLSASDNNNDEKDDYKTRLIKFYEKYNPSKIDTVDSTLIKYIGKEEEMFRKLESKYVKPSATTTTSQLYPEPSGNGPKCYIEFTIDGDESSPRRVVVKLYEDKVPLTTNNFKCLCTGEITDRMACGKPIRYLHSKIHRIVSGFCIQMGDYTTGDGRGGHSIYETNSKHGDGWGKFKDETNGFMNHSKKGLLSMANSGKDTNSSQFFFTLKPVPYLNGKHVIFGEVIDGMDILHEIEKLNTDQKTQRPLKSVVISNCGIIDNETGIDIPSVGTTTMKNKNPAAALSTTKPAFGVLSSIGGTTTTTGCSPFSSNAGSSGKSAFGMGGVGIGSSLFSNSTTATTTNSPFGIAASSFAFKPAAVVSNNNTFGGQSGGFGNTTTTTGFGSFANNAVNTATATTSTAATFGSVSSIGGTTSRSAFDETGGSNNIATTSPLSSFTTPSSTAATIGGGFGTSTSTNATATFGSLANADNATSTTKSSFVSAFVNNNTPSTSVFGASSNSNNTPSSFAAFGGASSSSPSSVFGNNNNNNTTDTNTSLFGGTSSSPFTATPTVGNAFTSMNNTRSSTSNDIDDDDEDDSDDDNNDGYSDYSNTDSESDDDSNF